MFLDLLQLSLTNLFRARGRLLITASGVVIGTTAVIILIGLTNGLQASAEAGIGSNEQLTQIFVFPNYQTVDLNEDVEQITLARVEEFRALDGVASVLPILPLEREATITTGRYENSVAVFGIDYTLLDALKLNVLEGSLDTLTENDMVVGERIQRDFIESRSNETWIKYTVDLVNPDAPIRINVQNAEENRVERIEATPTTIVSSTEYDVNNIVFLPFDTVMNLNKWILNEPLAPEDIIFEEIIVQSTGREATLNVIDALTEMGFATDSLGDYIAEINGFFNLLRLVLGGVGFVALLIAAFGVANTMMMAIIERTSEIGLMKAVGARDSDVLLVFLIEAGLVGLVGGLAGSGIALFLQQRINTGIINLGGNNQLSMLINTAELTGDLIIIPSGLLLFAVMLATVIGVAAGIVPALRASSLSPLVALKTE